MLHAWAVIIGAMALYAAWPSALTLVVAVALIGARQLGLMVLMVFVPCWKLRQAHALLLGKRCGPRMEIAPGYGDVLRRATR